MSVYSCGCGRIHPDGYNCFEPKTEFFSLERRHQDRLAKEINRGEDNALAQAAQLQNIVNDQNHKIGSQQRELDSVKEKLNIMLEREHKSWLEKITPNDAHSVFLFNSAHTNIRHYHSNNYAESLTCQAGNIESNGRLLTHTTQRGVTTLSDGRVFCRSGDNLYGSDGSLFVDPVPSHLFAHRNLTIEQEFNEKFSAKQQEIAAENERQRILAAESQQKKDQIKGALIMGTAGAIGIYCLINFGPQLLSDMTEGLFNKKSHEQTNPVAPEQTQPQQAETSPPIQDEPAKPAEPAHSAGLHYVRGFEGIVITGLVDDGPAMKAGLRSGDVIVRINGINTKSASDKAIGNELNSDKKWNANLVVRNREGYASLVISLAALNKDSTYHMTRREEGETLPGVPYGMVVMGQDQNGNPTKSTNPADAARPGAVIDYQPLAQAKAEPVKTTSTFLTPMFVSTATALNVRKDADATAESLGKMGKNSCFFVFKEGGYKEFAKISGYTDANLTFTGFVSRAYVQPIPEGTHTLATCRVHPLP